MQFEQRLLVCWFVPSDIAEMSYRALWPQRGKFLSLCVARLVKKKKNCNKKKQTKTLLCLVAVLCSWFFSIVQNIRQSIQGLPLCHSFVCASFTSPSSGALVSLDKPWPGCLHLFVKASLGIQLTWVFGYSVCSGGGVE